MSEIKPLNVRACPICRVAMVHSDFGWSCPQCGSAIIDPSKGKASRREEAAEPPARAAASGTLRN
jgi:ribosomal protein S27E